MAWYYDDWRPYVPVAERRRQAARKVAEMKKAGREVAPVIAGRKIVTTFWGEAWCANLEAYSDYANRLPRGRTYVRNGSVVDLQIETGRVRALVSGSDIYRLDIKIKPLAGKRWAEIKGRCAGQIDSLVELLQGTVSRGVMDIVTRKGEGLFPSPREITLKCSCPDWATMCKHVAATLYGVGARLDHEPELLFTLRGVDPAEMVEAAVDQPAASASARKGRVLESAELSSVFGVDIEADEGNSAGDRTPPARRGRAASSANGSASRVRRKKRAASSRATTPATGKSGARRVGAGKAGKATAKERAASKAASGKKKGKKTTEETSKKSERRASAKTSSGKRRSAKRPAAKRSRRKNAGARG